MKKILLTVNITLMVVSFVASQSGVGVNTDNPQAVFHVDAKKDNGTTNPPVNTADDVVISSEGYMGVGKVDPTVGLDIVGTLRLNDGTQQAGRMLVSKDNQGASKWVNLPSTLLKIGELNENSVIINQEQSVNAVDVTTTPLILTPGKWLVFAKFAIVGNSSASNNIWIYLKNMDTGNFENVLGITVEQTGGYIGTPQLTALVNVPDTQPSGYEYRILATTSNPSIKTISGFNGAIFYALRVDENTL